MSERKTIAASIRLAHACLSDAQLLHAAGSRNAAYLCQQALEQIIRALATSEGLHIERAHAHQLDKTVRRFPKENSAAPILRTLVWLEAYATTFRYPTEGGRIPDPPDGRRLSAAITTLGGLLARVTTHFDVNLASADSPAASARPMR